MIFGPDYRSVADVMAIRRLEATPVHTTIHPPRYIRIVHILFLYTRTVPGDI